MGAVTADEWLWKWVGDGVPDKSGKRGRMYYKAMSSFRSFDRLERTYNVGEAVLLSGGIGVLWIGQIVNLFEEPLKEYLKNKRSRKIKGREPDYPTGAQLYRLMRCTIRWLESPNDLVGDPRRGSGVPPPTLGEVYITDHVENDGFHCVTDIRGKAWMVGSVQSKEAFFREPDEGYEHELDRISVARCFINAEQTFVRNLDSGELQYILANPCRDKNLYDRPLQHTLGKRSAAPVLKKLPIKKRKRSKEPLEDGREQRVEMDEDEIQPENNDADEIQPDNKESNIVARRSDTRRTLRARRGPERRRRNATNDDDDDDDTNVVVNLDEEYADDDIGLRSRRRQRGSNGVVDNDEVVVVDLDGDDVPGDNGTTSREGHRLQKDSDDENDVVVVDLDDEDAKQDMGSRSVQESLRDREVAANENQVGANPDDEDDAEDMTPMDAPDLQKQPSQAGHKEVLEFVEASHHEVFDSARELNESISGDATELCAAGKNQEVQPSAKPEVSKEHYLVASRSDLEEQETGPGNEERRSSEPFGAFSRGGQEDSKMDAPDKSGNEFPKIPARKERVGDHENDEDMSGRQRSLLHDVETETREAAKQIPEKSSQDKIVGSTSVTWDVPRPKKPRNPFMSTARNRKRAFVNKTGQGQLATTTEAVNTIEGMIPQSPFATTVVADDTIEGMPVQLQAACRAESEPENLAAQHSIRPGTESIAYEFYSTNWTECGEGQTAQRHIASENESPEKADGQATYQEITCPAECRDTAEDEVAQFHAQSVMEQKEASDREVDGTKKDTDSESSVDGWEEVQEILNQMKKECGRMPKELQERFSSQVSVAFALALQLVREHGLSGDVEVGDSKVNRIVKEALDVYTRRADVGGLISGTRRSKAGGAPRRR